ncbi:pilus assembly protein CpaE [Bordetella petrii]|nr:pilus assembly protein CpaE [Bordetella petrii]
MKAHSTELAGLQSGIRFLFCSQGDGVAAQLVDALGPLGMLTQESPSVHQLGRRLADIDPKIIFLDFTLGGGDPGKLLRSADLARTLARVAPAIPRVAVGLLGQPEGAIAALRAGVTDFVDPSVAPHEVREVVQRLLDMPAAGGGEGGSRRDVLLIGARAGVGTSTLAAHLAGIVQDRYVQAQLEQHGSARKPADAGATLPLAARVALLDLGWPIGDAQLYVNVTGDFDFAEAARNLQRLDATLLGSAMAHTRDGLSVMALPRDPSQMNHMSQSDSLLVFERMRQHFGLMVTDTGGFSNMDFVAGLARTSHTNWIVTDQSVSSLVALSGVLQDLERRHVERSSLGLVVNRYDERYGMTAQQIAERFQLDLVGTLPDRALALMVCTNQGRLLHQDAERDVYVRGVQALAEKLCNEASQAAGRASWLATWLPGVHRRMLVAE